jgi:hypothetical protein
MYEVEPTWRDSHLTIHPHWDTIIILRHFNCTVTINSFNVHCMTIFPNVRNSYIPNSRGSIYGDSCAPSVIIPPFCIPPATPVRHVPAACGYPVGGIAHAFAVIHPPTIYHAILRSICPYRRISSATSTRARRVTPPPTGAILALLASACCCL